MKRLKSMRQLEKKYAQEIKEQNCINYVQFTYDCVSMSSCPEETFKSWYLDLNKKARKEFCQEALLNLEDYGQRFLRWAIKYL